MRTKLACCALTIALGFSSADAQDKTQHATVLTPEAGIAAAPASPASVKSENVAAARPQASAEPWRWRVLRTAWSEQDERAYEEFVQRIGESGCKTVHDCLTDPKANPLYRASNPADMRFYADCADLPYVLRAY